jgi:hypothetical protein
MSNCPTPYKDGFTTEHGARRALRDHEGKKGRTAVHVYMCECGRWHLAGPRRPVSEETRKRRHRRKGGAKKRRGRYRAIHD